MVHRQPQCPVDDSFFDQIADWVGVTYGKLSTNNKRKPETNPETQLKRFYTASVATTHWETPIGMQEQRHRATESLRANAEAISHPRVALASKKWRHWKPRDAKGLPSPHRTPLKHNYGTSGQTDSSQHWPP